MRSFPWIFFTLTLSAGGCGGKVVDPSLEDAGASSVPPGDAGTGPSKVDASSTVGGACNALGNTAAVVAVEQVASDPPAPLGGTIVDGVYDLTHATVYTGASGPSGPTGTAMTTVDIEGSVVEIASTGTPATRTTTLSTSGTTFTATDVCPDTGVTTGAFTATATSLAIFLDGGEDDAGARTLVETFTRR